MSRVVHAVDAFCGAGGTSTGLALACRDLGYEIDLLAINHWKIAVESHARNHPWARHLCSRVESVRPRDAFPGGKLDLLVASPECTHHSVARGGRPVSDQLRASAWHLIPWLEELEVGALLVENVPEFESWCRVGRTGRPVKKERGSYFREWVRAVRTHGYNVDWRVLNSADFGDATSRRRLFVMARRGNKPIIWPRPVRSRGGRAPGTRPWKAARDIIDWSLKGQSIFGRKRPLAGRTLARIVEGLRRFGGKELRPFLVLMEHGGGTLSVDSCLPTITAARGGSMGLAEPFILSPEGVFRGNAPRGVDDPVGTITQRGGGHLVEAFVVRTNFHPADGRMGAAPRSVDDPLPTVLSSSEGLGLAEPFIVPNFGERFGQAPRLHSVAQPLPTVTSHGAGALVEPFLTTYYRAGGVSSVGDPAPTVTTKDRIALVQPVVNGMVLDIRFRMLEPHELAAAMGFPADYGFAGTRADVVRQIGNAVSVETARWLCLALLGGNSVPRSVLKGVVEATSP